MTDLSVLVLAGSVRPACPRVQEGTVSGGSLGFLLRCNLCGWRQEAIVSLAATAVESWSLANWMCQALRKNALWSWRLGLKLGMCSQAEGNICCGECVGYDFSLIPR